RNGNDGPPLPLTAKTPASAPLNPLPPRSRAPGPLKVFAPARHIASSLKPRLQPRHTVDSGTQSATHSLTFPTMSNAPQADLQFDREPVLVGALTPPPPLFVLHSVVASSTLSGVPAAARCHS